MREELCDNEDRISTNPPELPVRGMRRYKGIYEQLLDETFGPSWIDDPSLSETPTRMAKAWVEMTAGYTEQIDAYLKLFPAPPGPASEMVIVRDVKFHSLCEHHGALFMGKATVGYIPQGSIIGLSKIPRIVRACAAKLQVQERLTNEIADVLWERDLKPLGVGVIITARHMCMESRGVRAHGTSTVTSALRGVMFDGEARAEFLSLAR